MELGREHNILATSAGKRPADDLLGLSLRVHVGRVDEVDAGVECAVDDLDRCFVVGVSPGTEHHRPEAQRAYLDTGSPKLSQLHPANVYDGLGGVEARLLSGGRGTQRLAMVMCCAQPELLAEFLIRGGANGAHQGVTQ